MKKFVLGTWSISGDYGYKNLNSERSLINDYAVDIEDVTNKLNNQYVKFVKTT